MRDHEAEGPSVFVGQGFSVVGVHEEHLGTVLFRRMNRSLMLTDEGQALLPAVREAFDLLSAGVRRVQDLCSGGALSISTTPSFS